MRPTFPEDVLRRAFGPRHAGPEDETKVPCPRCAEEAPDRLCPLCSGVGMVSIATRAEWFATRAEVTHGR